MIIQCVNCNKKFEVDSKLIPESGRDLECGSCQYTWFYKYDLDKNYQIIEEIVDVPSNKKSSKSDTIISEIFDDELIPDNNAENVIMPYNIDKNLVKRKQNSSNSNISLGNILSYLFICIITFIALIIILDTFKSPLNRIFPNLEFLLFNLFETLEDIFLFLKNLLL